MTQYCRRVNCDNTIDIISEELTNNGGAWQSKLVCSPFRYKHNNITYDLNQNGVYKFHVPYQNTTNLIINNGDLKDLLASLCYLIVPGQLDEGKTNTQLTSKSYSSRLHIMCTTSAQWVQYQLGLLGIQSRIIRCLRGDTPNNFYDGHVILEVKDGAYWRLLDPNMGLWFAGSAAKDVFPVTDVNVFQYLHMGKINNGTESLINNQYHHSSTIDLFLGNDIDLRNFQLGIMQIPGIDHTDGLTYFYLPTQHLVKQAWVLSLSASFRIVDFPTWLGMFY